MRYGLGNILVCRSWRFGAAMPMLSVWRQRSLSLDLISVSLWDILGKPKDIISTTAKRTKCLLLGMRSFLRKSFSQKKLVGAQCDSKRFEKHKKCSCFTDEEEQQDEPTIIADQHVEPQPRRSIRARHATKKYTLLCWTMKSLTLTYGGGNGTGVREMVWSHEIRNVVHER